MLGLIKGASAVGAIEVVQSVPTGTDIGEVIKLVIQVAVGLATIFNLLKKKKNEL